MIELIVGTFIGVIIMSPFLLVEQKKVRQLEGELKGIAKSVGGAIKKYGEQK